MAITIHKILNVINDPNHEGKLVVHFVLDDGLTKKKNKLGNLNNDNVSSKTTILLKAQSLFDDGELWENPEINVESPIKNFFDNWPSLDQIILTINSITPAEDLSVLRQNIQDIKVLLRGVARAINALNERRK